MRTLGVIMIGVGAVLAWEAWESHKTGNPPTPIQHARAAITGQANTAATSDTQGTVAVM